MNNTALLLIDLQNDFCPSGALAVSAGDKVIAVANQAILFFQQQQAPVVASMDWHPQDHRSFAVNSGTQVGEVGMLNGLIQVWWPAHCIQNSKGAELHPDLNQAAISKLVYKGNDPQIDSYSAFFDNGRKKSTDLHQWLQSHHIQTLWIMGLATDYCVQYSVLDALSLGYQVIVITDGCRAVNLQPGDSDNALKKMASQGSRLLRLDEAIQNTG